MHIPKLIEKGDRIAIVAPSGKLEAGDLDAAIDALTSWGLEVVLGKHVYARDNHFAGKDTDRLSDLQWALDGREINAVLCARGGYGLSRIIDQINFTNLRAFPKWIIGYSDITVLLLKLQAIGLAGIHGPMAISFKRQGSLQSVNELKTLLFEGISTLESLTSPENEYDNLTDLKAELTGGNLSLVIDSLATVNEINTKGRIFFLEDVGEKMYKVDRMFQHLKRAGKLSEIPALIIGQFSSTTDDDASFGSSLEHIISSTIDPNSCALRLGFSFGHEPQNQPLVMGGTYQLKLEKGITRLSWRHPHLEDKA